jgi:myosin-crossreactive antigen
MALESGSCKDGTGLAGLMADKLIPVIEGFDRTNPATYNYFDSLAEAIVEYVTSNAEVSIETTVEVDDVSNLSVNSGIAVDATPPIVPATTLETSADGTVGGTASGSGTGTGTIS